MSDADDREPTEAEVGADKQLAAQTVIASLTGLAAIASVDAGAAATGFAPIASAIVSAAVIRLGRRRVEQATETVMDGAAAAGVPLGEFIDKATSDARRHELFARALRIAQDTALREKRRALGRALANGIMRDDAQIDPELLFIRAVEDIDEMHIRLLEQLASLREVPGLSVAQIEGEPGFGSGGSARALIGTLQLHNLVQEDFGPVRRGPFGDQSTIIVATESGRQFLERLADDDTR